LISKEENKAEEGDGEKATHIAAAATAIATWRLKIGITKFCQWRLPIREDSAPSGRRSFYGNGSWGK
jgi:hypothetical protein